MSASIREVTIFRAVGRWLELTTRQGMHGFEMFTYTGTCSFTDRFGEWNSPLGCRWKQAFRGRTAFLQPFRMVRLPHLLPTPAFTEAPDPFM